MFKSKSEVVSLISSAQNKLAGNASLHECLETIRVHNNNGCVHEIVFTAINEKIRENNNSIFALLETLKEELVAK